MNFLSVFGLSASGLTAHRRRMDLIATNLANIETTRTARGGPYRRKLIVMRSEPLEDFESRLDSELAGVKVDGVVEDKRPPRKVFDPGHPDADEEGYVFMPNVELIVEMTNMLHARRAFEANVTAIKTTKQMVLKAIEIGR